MRPCSRLRPGGQRQLGQLIIDRARELGLEAMADEDAGGGPRLGIDDRQWMLGAKDHRIAAVEPEGDGLATAFPLHAHFHGAEGGRFHLDIELFGGRDEDM